jgi:ArsR family transcriptional regulator
MSPATRKRAGCCDSLLSQRLVPTVADDLAQAFAALGDPVRLRLFNLIAQAGEACSCEFEAPLAKSQPTISHHTRILAEA